MNDKVKGLVLGLVIGTTLTGASAFAANSAKIEVLYENLKYMVDGVQKVPTAGKGFIYQGTTYVPLRFAGESLGKEVTWDGKNKTIWIGKKDSNFTYLTDVPYARIDMKYDDELYFDKNKKSEKITIASNVFQKGISFHLESYTSEDKGSVDYNLNSKYTKFTGSLGIDDSTKNFEGEVKYSFIGDNKELATYTVKGGDNPIPVSVDLTSVLKFRIVCELISPPNQVEKAHPSIGEAKLY